MSSAHQSQVHAGASGWRAAMCVLLVLVSLYNPFLTVSGACEDLHLHHPLSFRATIASSELRRGMLEEDPPLFPALDALKTADSRAHEAPLPFVFPARHSHEGVVPVQQVVLDGLWFRPPPSR